MLNYTSVCVATQRKRLYKMLFVGRRNVNVYKFVYLQILH